MMPRVPLRLLQAQALCRPAAWTDVAGPRRAQVLPDQLRLLSTQSQDDGSPVVDVAIVGGGMVGAALAALLASNPITRNLTTLVIDQQKQALSWQPPSVPELRVSTVTPATIRCFQRAGAWDIVEPHAARFSTMQVWDTAGPGCIRWHAASAGAAHIGAVAENSLLQTALLQSIQRQGCMHLPDASVPTTTASGSNDSQGLKFELGLTCLWPVTLDSVRLPSAVPSSSPASRTDSQAASQQESSASSAGQQGSQVSEAQGQGGEASMSGVSSADALAQLEFKGGHRLRARLVVAADGANSRVRHMAGLRTWGWGYGQRGLVATVAISGGGTDTAWQRFLPTGPLALLPVRDGLANIVWSTTPAMAQALEKLTPEEFAQAVNQALMAPPTNQSAFLSSLTAWGGRLATLAGQSLSSASSQDASDAFQAPPTVEGWVGYQPRSFPLQLKQSGRYVGPRLALIGDAAHAVHPLAGQGVNLGFGDAEVLADVITRAVECGQDIGSVLTLQEEYERPRQRAVQSMTAALETLHRVFGVQEPHFAGIRNLGLGLVNAAAPVKNQIMAYAMGL